jgi:hypothetical protein
MKQIKFLVAEKFRLSPHPSKVPASLVKLDRSIRVGRTPLSAVARR